MVLAHGRAHGVFSPFLVKQNCECLNTNVVCLNKEKNSFHISLSMVDFHVCVWCFDGRFT